MSPASTLTSAIEELSRAVEGIERAALRQASKGDLVTELALIRIDRNKLAEALDDALSRVKALDASRIQAGEKIEHAVASLRAMLAKDAQIRESQSKDSMSKDGAAAEGQPSEGGS